MGYKKKFGLLLVLLGSYSPTKWFEWSYGVEKNPSQSIADYFGISNCRI